MSLFKKLSRTNKVRWLFFGIATVAVLALTGMNIYSLYALRDSTVESAKESKKSQLEEFVSEVQYPLYRPFWGVNKLNTRQLEDSWESQGQFPEKFIEVVDEALSTSLFTDVYFSPGEVSGCNDPSLEVYSYEKTGKNFNPSVETPGIVCDGFGISQSRIRTNLDDWRWNSKVTFDSHRTMTLALIDLNDRRILGHLGFTINQEYLLNEYLPEKMKKQFGSADDSGIVVWLRDWVQDEILAGSDDNYTYDRDTYPIDLRQSFSSSFDDWTIHASFIDSPTVAASNISLQRNLIVLGFAVFVLFGALMFIFINAKRERELAERQAGFLANITHELKTPLAVMQAAGENIADGRVTDGERLKSYGDHIFTESVRLKKMIEKLLDAAKVDSQQTMAEQAPHQISNLVREFHEANQRYIEQKGFKFTFESDDQLPLVMIDPDHLDTILNNLVENAIKYSSVSKEIKLSVTSDKQKVTLQCTDSGLGIPKKSLGLIFDKFYRVENTMTAKTKGHGLGLSIVKKMVQLNNGQISVKSRPGKGSTFTITFPAFLQKGDEQTTHKTSTTNGVDVQNRKAIDDYVE